MPPTVTATAAAVGIDLGSYNARVATFDDNLGHPVCAHNHDGDRTTRVVVPPDHQQQNDDSNNNYSSGKNLVSDPVTAEHLPRFLEEKLLQLAMDAAHTKELHVVTSIPNDFEDNNTALEDGWIDALKATGGILTEAAAVCLAYDIEEELLAKSDKRHPRILVVDAGASGLKVARLKATNGIWCLESTHKLPSVNGPALVEALSRSVAQQFEIKHRFPRDEVYQSKKARAKLHRACELGLPTIQINNTAQIHIDGLYEGMDCNVTMSKAKFDHLCSKLVKDAMDFLKSLPTDDDIDSVLLSGNMHVWLRPIVESVFPGKIFSSTSSSSIDPSEAVAVGCTKQARWNLTHPQHVQNSTSMPATLHVPVSPVAISLGYQEQDEEVVLIEEGAPLPALVNHRLELDDKTGETDSSSSSSSSSSYSVEIWQTKPSRKHLVTLNDVQSSYTIRMLLLETGQLRIAFGGQSVVIG
jgi:molecular chaperone DnaK (HSP70)